MSYKTVPEIVSVAKRAFPYWSKLPIRDRVKHLTKFKSLIVSDMYNLTNLITVEHGKNLNEARAEIEKGLETLEYSEAGAVLMAGKKLEVSKGVYCEESHEALGVVTSICPFNFPMMVPFWTIPLALVSGNCIVVKPSEKVPRTLDRILELSQEAGFPEGVFSLAHGGVDTVNKLVTHPDIRAVTFVGSSPIAKIVGDMAQQHGKKAVCLGGANNHLVLLPDADMELAARDIVSSFCGCSGQRCMAASVLCTVGIGDDVIDNIVSIANKTPITRLIDKASTNNINQVVDRARKDPECEILLDGGTGTINTFRPTIIRVKRSMIVDGIEVPNKRHWLANTEVFGPVLVVVECNSIDDAIKHENDSEFGNGAVVYTQSGAHAEYATSRFQAGMIGVNVGVPVPREPFSFGGNNLSNVTGHHDITGMDGINFFTRKRKITTRWGGDKTIF